MRVNNSIKNVIVSVLSNFVSILIGFACQIIFTKTLGLDYLGINGLFTNIMSMLAVVELGLGSAIVYNLYKPIAVNDVEKIKSWMNFYKKSYHIIAIIIFAIGFMVVPFLRTIVGPTSVKASIYIIYFLFLTDCVCSYLLSYKRSILYAQQKNYVVNLVHILYLIVMNVFQIIVLLLTKNYYLYLILKITMRIVENVIITIIADRLYPYLKDKKLSMITSEEKKDVFQKIKALFFHKVAGFVVSGTDNIIISAYLGVKMVGLYSNYLLIITAVTTILNQVFTSLTASVGNLLVTSAKEKNYVVFRRIRFLNYFISSFCTVSIIILMQPFISIFFGEKYLLSNITLIVLGINFYLQTTRLSFLSFKEAAGIFYEDRFVPVLESVVNIVSSIILLKFFGIAGVFMGTVLSNLVLHLYSYPKYVYKKLFDRSYLKYYKEMFGFLLIAVISGLLTYVFSTLVIFSNITLTFILKIVICLLIPNLFNVLIFRNKEELKYFINLFKQYYTMIIKHLKRNQRVN